MENGRMERVPLRDQFSGQALFWQLSQQKWAIDDIVAVIIGTLTLILYMRKLTVKDPYHDFWYERPQLGRNKANSQRELRRDIAQKVHQTVSILPRRRDQYPGAPLTGG